MNKTLFANVKNRATAVNEAGGLAYRLPPKHALAQLAATGCFNGAYYGDAEAQLAALLALVDAVADNEFLAKLAVYARERAFMKDMPAALLLVLSKRDPGLFHRAFDRVVDNGRVLRTLFQMLRSGLFGRKSLSYSLQRAFNRWLNGAGVGALLSASIGNDPSLRDVLRAARPTPRDDARRALFGWLTGKPVEKWAPATLADLPEEVSALTAFRLAQNEYEQAAILNAPSSASGEGRGGGRFRWDLLADSARGPLVWKAIALQMGHQALRMNLNTLLRHGVFDDAEMVSYVAARLADVEEVKRARQFPYQYLAAYLNAEAALAAPVRDALQAAAEAACGNVPELPGPVVVGVDVSGSMASPVTGSRGPGGTSKMRCVDVAALFGAAVLRRNPGSVVVPFDTSAHRVEAAADEPILSVAARFAGYGGGGTNCSLPLHHANTALKNRAFAGCVLVSDNESWVGAGRGGQTATLTEWEAFVRNQRRVQGPAFAPPKLVCIDLQPYGTVQAPDREDILNVGGFSDAEDGVVAGFLADDANRFVTEVEAIEL
jgi:60 kDa SS-A/Ro ribonucleoprotein